MTNKKLHIPKPLSYPEKSDFLNKANIQVPEQYCCTRTTLCTLTGGLPTIHIDPTKGNTKLRQVANLNETQVYPIRFFIEM